VYAVIEALRWLQARCKVERWGVVNMSFNLKDVIARAPQFSQELHTQMCAHIAAANTNCGTVFVAAAGKPCEDETRGSVVVARGQ